MPGHFPSLGGPAILNSARQRDFRFLLAAIGVSAVGSRVTRTALPMAAILLLGDGLLTVYLITETTLRQRAVAPELLGRSAAVWKMAAAIVAPAGMMRRKSR